MDDAARERAGISATLLRLSIGIEEGDDLARDLVAGLDAAGRC
jgi:cystathionine gamma-synthase